MALTAPQEASGGDGGKKGGVEDPETDLFPFHIHAYRVQAKGLEARIAGRFSLPADQEGTEKEDGHGAPDGPAMLLIFDHAAQIIGQAAGDEKDGQHLKKIG